MRSSLIFFAALVCLVMAGCGGSGNSTPVNLQSGNWSVAATSAVTLDGSFTAGGSLVQTGSTISGVVHIPASKCFRGDLDVAVTGSVTGQTMSLSFAATPDQTINVDAKAGSATTFSGTYTVTGTGCAAGDHGTINATLVPSVSAPWQGVFTSVVNPGTVVTFTATLTQSPTADAHGFFPVTGTLTVTGTSCLTSGAILATSNMSGANMNLFATADGQPTSNTIFMEGPMDDPATATSISKGQGGVSGANCPSDNGHGSMSRS